MNIRCNIIIIKRSLKLWSLITTKLNDSESNLEVDSDSAKQEIPCLLWNPKVHYHVHKTHHLCLKEKMMILVCTVLKLSFRVQIVFKYVKIYEQFCFLMKDSG